MKLSIRKRFTIDQLRAYSIMAEVQPSPQTPSALTAIWQRFQSQYLAHVTVLEQAITAQLTDTLTTELEKQAIQKAHLLIGSLASFGLTEASRLSREIELIFRAGVKQNLAQSVQLQQLVIALRQELERGSSVSFEPQDGSTTVKQQPCLLIVDTDPHLTNQLISEAILWGIPTEVVTLAKASWALSRKRRDVVLLDLCSQEATNGLDLLALATSHQQKAVLVLLAESDFANRVKVARLGGKILGPKPILPAAVLAAVTQELQHSDIVPAKILVVDDDIQTLDMLRSLLEPWGFHLTLLDQPQLFWDTLERTHPDLLILDLEMPQFNGLDLCRVVRNDSKWSELPVLFLSAHRDEETVNRVFTSGGDDYVSKPVIGPELIARILNRLERMYSLRRLAEIDILTGIANRRKAILELTRLLHLTKRQQQPLCFIIIDLDWFKQVNDQYGHATGDQVLRQFGSLLRQSFRSEDMVARWGGEEFVIGLFGATQQQAWARITQLQAAMYQQEFTSASGQKFRVTFSGGIAEYPVHGIDLQALYRSADAALYRAKTEGRNRIVSSPSSD